jgi:hypothetical protein
VADGGQLGAYFHLLQQEQDFFVEVETGPWDPGTTEQAINKAAVLRGSEHAEPAALGVAVASSPGPRSALGQPPGSKKTEQHELLKKDVGTWDAVARALDLDPAGNAVTGDATLLDTHDSVVWNETGEPVVVFGMRVAHVEATGAGACESPLGRTEGDDDDS